MYKSVQKPIQRSVCSELALHRAGLSPARAACAAFNVAIAEKRAGRFMIRQRIRVVKRYPDIDW